MSLLDLHWFALHVKPRHEKTVSQALRSKGYEAFLPTYEHRHRSARTYRTAQLPLFSTYTFGRFDKEGALPVLGIPGVLYIVSTGRTPTPVAPGEIEALRTMVQSGLPVECCAPEEGDLVEIVAGPLRGLQGVLLSRGGRSRFLISITLLHRSVSTEVDCACVKMIRRGPGYRPLETYI
jgi:transcriptional antiterminator NusG